MEQLRTHWFWCEVEISQCIEFDKQRPHHRLDFNMLWIFLFLLLTFLQTADTKM